MKKVILLLVVLSLTGSGCRDNRKGSAVGSSDSRFQQISEEFIKGYLDRNPLIAVQLGIHEYDGKITDYRKTAVDAEISRLKTYDRLLNELDTTTLSAQAHYDFRILNYALQGELFKIEDMQPYTKNPMTYAAALDILVYITRDFAPLEERLQSIMNIQKQAPAVFMAARENLEDSLALPFIETAIQIANGYADFLANDLVTALQEVKNDSLMRAFNTLNGQTIKELNAFTDYLEKEKLPKAMSVYAIGTEKFNRMLQAEGVDVPAHRILEMGMAELEKEKAAFTAAAKRINPAKTPAAVLLDIQQEHPSAEQLIPSVRKDVGFIHQFLHDKKIVTVPSKIQPQVQETPPFLRSVSTASMDTPGPFEKKATQAYYYITPVEPEWSTKQKNDWLAMFDPYTTSIVTIHEAYPGHYTQFLHLNASGATRLEKILGSYSFIEGWAHYTEKMMIDEGYGNTGDSIEAAKYQLAQLNESILRLCRLCVAIQMHCNGMSVEEATSFLMEHWQQGELPSRAEATRGTYDPGFLFYSLGKWELLKLREDYQTQEGAAFSLQQFHDRILGHGMPPIILLRQSLLKDKNLWNQIL